MRILMYIVTFLRCTALIFFYLETWFKFQLEKLNVDLNY